MVEYRPCFFKKNVNFNNYNATLTDTQITQLSSSRLDYQTLINDAAASQSKQFEVDVFNSEIIGLDTDGLAKNGFGLGPATNGFVVRTTRDNFNN